MLIRFGNDVLAEIDMLARERLVQDVAVEDVDAHRGQEQIVAAVDAQLGADGIVHFQRVESGVFLRLFHEARDPFLAVDLHDAERARIGAVDRNRGHRDVGAGADVLLDDRAEIHPVKLIAGKNEDVLVRRVGEVAEVLPDGIGRALVPGVAARRLLRGHDLDEAVGKIVELVALLDVPMQRGTVELGEQKDALEARVEAVADRDIDDAIFARQRHGRLGAVLRQRKEPRAGASAKNDRDDVAGLKNSGASWRTP